MSTRIETLHATNSIASLTRRSFLAALGASAAMVGCASSGESSSSSPDDSADEPASSNPSSASSLTLDSTAWSYDQENDIYYQIGVQYCTAPQATEYESMGIYVPGAYFSAADNGDGTYTCEVASDAAIGSYTASTAPIVFPVNTAGYSAQAAPTEYDAQGVADYTSAGLIYVYAGCRGRDNGENPDGSTFAGGAPWGVTDLKAAIRCIRYNAALLPGDKNRIFTFGHSGGGAQSALVGATGDSPLYTPYLEAIGAAFTDADGAQLSDATYGAMCWCPITSLDVADAAYEWMMGQYATTGTREDGTWTALLSQDLAETFASYINTCGFATEDSGPLALSEGGEGIFAAGPYYDYLLSIVEGSLNGFLSDTEFPYTPSSDMKADGGFGGGPSGGHPEKRDDAEGTASDSQGAPDGTSPDGTTDAGPSGAPSGEPPEGMMAGGPGGSDSSSDSSESTAYEDAQAYIDHLNAEEEWVSFDATTNTATITSLGAFARHCKTPTKDVGAFDMLDRTAAENKVFGTAESDALHFDATMAQLLADNADDYAAASGWNDSYPSDFASDLQSVDDLGNDSAVRQNLYNPLYFLCDAYEGYGSVTPASHWRIRTGIEQGDTSLTTEVNLALALAARSDVTDVDFATVWGQGHTMAERSGSATENLLAWIESCK